MTTHESVSQRDALDIVFANRNRAYGAYQLRREYPNTLGRAFAMGLSLIVLMVLLPHILAAFSSTLPEKPITGVIAEPTVIILEKPAPPPVVQIQPPPLAAIAYTPPVVAPDDEVPEEKPVEVATILEDPRTVGAKTVDGPPDGPPMLDPASTGLGIIETPPTGDEKTYDGFAVNKMPSFPGGEAAMFKWIYKHLSYPEIAKEEGVQGQVVLTFVVGREGAISDITIVKYPVGGNILGNEATRVVKAMPKWSPGEANGHPVKVRFTLPIRFALK